MQCLCGPCLDQLNGCPQPSRGHERAGLRLPRQSGRARRAAFEGLYLMTHPESAARGPSACLLPSTHPHLGQGLRKEGSRGDSRVIVRVRLSVFDSQSRARRGLEAGADAEPGNSCRSPSGGLPVPGGGAFAELGAKGEGGHYIHRSPRRSRLPCRDLGRGPPGRQSFPGAKGLQPQLWKRHPPIDRGAVLGPAVTAVALCSWSVSIP